MGKMMEWVHGFIGLINWKLTFSLFHSFDWFFLAFLVSGIIYGSKRGFLRSAVELAEFLLVIFAVVGNYSWLGFKLTHWIPMFQESVTKPAAYFLILATVWAAVMVIDQNLKQLIQAKTFPPLKIIGGAILGLIFFLLIFALISKGLSMMPQDSVSQLFEERKTYFGKRLAGIPVDFYATVMKKLGALLGTK
ncbi:MAG: CvpA family protein [Candidatus Omnitrophica bacterium]|nr:CvpA family protein [Candidatus Omnitrophota bacterium]